jgi:hypothetical protein
LDLWFFGLRYSIEAASPGLDVLGSCGGGNLIKQWIKNQTPTSI